MSGNRKVSPEEKLRAVYEYLEGKELFVVTKNKSDEIESIDFNTALLNEALLKVAKKSRKRLIEKIKIDIHNIIFFKMSSTT